MKTIVRQSKTAILKKLSHLFIEITAKNCNQKCKKCYIDFPQFKKCEDFIDIDIIKTTLKDTSKEDIQCIYLSGAEPMTHPDFNSILRLCLKRTNVCICTNGSFINEKKARFLKKVESESPNEIIFNLSLVHYDEVKNDDIRYRGAYRHTLFAVKHLIKYNFSPIITVPNYYDTNPTELEQNIKVIFKNYNYEIDKSHLKIIPWYDYETNQESEIIPDKSLKKDCEYSRVLTSKGVYGCPFLSDDYRGRCGSDFNNYTDKISLEAQCCNTCLQYGKQIFGIDFDNFK